MEGQWLLRQEKPQHAAACSGHEKLELLTLGPCAEPQLQVLAAAGPRFLPASGPCSAWGDAAVGRGERDAAPPGDSPLPPCSTDPVPGRMPPGSRAEVGWEPMELSKYC